MCEVRSKQTADFYWDLILKHIEKSGCFVKVEKRAGETRASANQIITKYNDSLYKSEHKAQIITIALGEDEDPEYKNSVLIHEYGHMIIPEVKNIIKKEFECWIAGEKAFDKNWIPINYWRHANKCLKTYVDSEAEEKKWAWTDKININFAIGAWAFATSTFFMIGAIKIGIILAGG